MLKKIKRLLKKNTSSVEGKNNRLIIVDGGGSML